MSDPENFVARWSRRKHAAAEESETKASAAVPAGTAAGDEQRGERAPPAPAGAPPQASVLPFDPAKLPPIESITAESDIRAFLAPGVPAELTRAALRRVWAADPKIRDFVGLADYDWDFNAPDGITGFGSLEMTDEMRRRVAEMVGRSLAAEASEPPAPTSVAGRSSTTTTETSIEPGVAAIDAPTTDAPSNVGMPQDLRPNSDDELHNRDRISQRDNIPVALQYNPEKPENIQALVKRSHGRALPK